METALGRSSPAIPNPLSGRTVRSSLTLRCTQQKAVEVSQGFTHRYSAEEGMASVVTMEGRIVNVQVLEMWWRGNVVSKLVGYINAAEHTMDVGVSGVTQDEVGQAVLAAFDRHVKIRLYTHLRRVRPEPKWIQTFIDYGIPVRHAPWTEEQTMPVDSDDDDSFPEMCIIDKNIVIMGSMNWSREALEGVFNIESSTIFEGECDTFVARFFKMWSQGHLTTHRLLIE